MLSTTLNDRFVLETELGRGGMGAVYRATDQILQRSVAIKVLKEITGEEVGKRLRLEAQILARLVHDGIVRLYDFGQDKGTYYFIMEEVDGTSFQKRWKRIDLGERLRILGQVAEALDYAHHQGVIHRDVKPANILLTATDQAKLSDFGLSLLADHNQETGVVRGTPHYMSPEQARGKKLDFRSDLYSLGVILYECATGSTPFQGQMMAIMSQHVNDAPPAPRERNPEISKELEQVILSLMAKKPEARPASGKEAARLLQSLMQGGLLLGPSAAEVIAPSVSLDLGHVAPDAGLAGAGPLVAQPSAPLVGQGPQVPASGGKPAATTPSRQLAGAKDSSSARDLLDIVQAEPMILSPDERYLCGHYLAYLLGGSRRRGFLRRRPLDPLNADRARLMLAMAFLANGPGTEVEVERAARLMDERPDVRPALTPIVVMKYLNSRENPRKRKRFRQLRRQLQDASKYADQNLTDEQGVLNPGLMPQALEDLHKISPERTEIDDELVERWNRVSEVWKDTPTFREAVLRYATRNAHRDPASAELWPEVVYPLIERARWQRKMRSRVEAVWDAVAENLRIPDQGVNMDRAMRSAMTEQVVAMLDESVEEFVEAPSLGQILDEEGPSQQSASFSSGIRAESFHDIEVESADQTGLIRLDPVNPFRHTLGELRSIWQEAMATLRSGAGAGPVRGLPIGPYRLTAVASIRARSAGQVVLQGMPNKQIEMLIPSFTGGGSASRIVVAVWLYENQSLVITYTDNQANQRYICWDAATNQQRNFEEADKLNHALYLLGMEVPDQLNRVLTKRFTPHPTA